MRGSSDLNDSKLSDVRNSSPSGNFVHEFREGRIKTDIQKARRDGMVVGDWRVDGWVSQRFNAATFFQFDELGQNRPPSGKLLPTLLTRFIVFSSTPSFCYQASSCCHRIPMADLTFVHHSAVSNSGLPRQIPGNKEKPCLQSHNHLFEKNHKPRSD
jgi:hypothetical protein